MEMALEANEAIFQNAGQAVHVAFLIMAQEATQDAPLRKALIKVMESIQLTNNQRNWLDELRGVGGGTINFAGLDGNEIRAQCAMVTQAVKSRLPKPEMWVLQAKFGQTEFEDVIDSVDADGQMMTALALAQTAVQKAQLEMDRGIAAKESRGSGPALSRDALLQRARQDSDDRMKFVELCDRVRALEADVRLIQIAIDQAKHCKLVDNGRRGQAGVARRRYVFSAERIAAIQGLSDWFRPMLPTVPALAIDCLLGRMFANHKKIDITFRDLAKSFGGSHVKYHRATLKMKAHVKALEQLAMERLEPIFAEQGVTVSFLESV